MILSIPWRFFFSFLAAFSRSCFLLNCRLNALSPINSSLENLNRRSNKVFFRVNQRTRNTCIADIATEADGSTVTSEHINEASHFIIATT